MAKRFSTLQKEAEEKGYTLNESGGHYYASWEGINLDDSDKERLVDDMDALIECSADDSPYTLQDNANEAGEAIISSAEGEFTDLYIAKALAKAKEAKLAKERPQSAPSKRAFSRAPKAPEPAPVEAAPEPKPDYKPGMPIEEVEPWDEPKPASPNGPAPALGQDDKAVLARLCGKMAELLLEAQRLLELPAQSTGSSASSTPRPRISRGR